MKRPYVQKRTFVDTRLRGWWRGHRRICGFPGCGLPARVVVAASSAIVLVSHRSAIAVVWPDDGKLTFCAKHRRFIGRVPGRRFLTVKS
jgi:hypothetical protein